MNKWIRTRTGNTLIELVIYIGLTIVITVGLANVIARVRTAQFNTSTRSEVQQSVRSSLQQLTTLSRAYEHAYCPPAPGVCVTGSSELYLWNESENENVDSTGIPTNFLRIWVEGDILTAQSHIDSQPTSSPIRLTPSSVTVDEFTLIASTEFASSPNIGINLKIIDNSPSSNAMQDSFHVSTAIRLRPKNVPLSAICCPQFLDAACPVELPRCIDGCFADYQDGSLAISDVLLPQAIALDTIRHRMFVSDGSSEVVKVYNLDETNTLQQTPAFLQIGPHTGNADQQFGEISALAYDSAADRLFIADKTKNRVLVYDTKNLTAGQTAMQVIGQPNFTTSGPSGGEKRLNAPAGLTMHDTRLFVADTGNNRVTFYDVSELTPEESAIGVFGANSVTGVGDGGSAQVSTLLAPRGLAFDQVHDRLFVADSGHNRVLMFQAYETGGNGNDADGVLGQPDFQSSATVGVDDKTTKNPSGLAYDSLNQRIIVSDQDHSRVLVFNAPLPLINGASADAFLGQPTATEVTVVEPDPGPGDLNEPTGLAFDREQQRLFVADTQNNRVLSFLGGSDPSCGGSIIEDITLHPPILSSSSASSEEALACGTPTLGQLASKINEDLSTNPPLSLNYTADYIEACGASGPMMFDLSNVPGDFDAVTQVTYRVVYKANTGTPGRFSSAGITVMQQDGTSPLMNGPAFSHVGEQPWTYEQVIANADAMVGPNTAEAWNGAKILVDSYSSSSFLQISAIELGIVYANGSKQATLRISGDTAGTETVWKGIGQSPDTAPVGYWPMSANPPYPARVDSVVSPWLHGSFLKRFCTTTCSDSGMDAEWSTQTAEEEFPLLSSTGSISFEGDGTYKWLTSVADHASLRFGGALPFSVSFYEGRPFGAVPISTPLIQKLAMTQTADIPPQDAWRGWSVDLVSSPAPPSTSQTAKYRLALFAGASGSPSNYYGVQTVASFPIANPPVFRHVLITYDAAVTSMSLTSRIHIYVNGVDQQLEVARCGGGIATPCNTSVVNFQTIAPHPPLLMGITPSLLDEVKIFNKVLSPLDAE